MNSDDAISQLVDAGLLTDRQAEAYVLRAVEGVPREAAAESMGISPNTLDNTLARAREKVRKAQATAEAVEVIRSPDIPEKCSECGHGLGQTWSRDSDGYPICIDCAGIDPAEATENISESDT
ncbi:sigma factor-like helix-turn-helix DNA-binding protein [Natrinema pallidum]|uniref:DUF134 domain-containing protein n=1 Tax=Natrinema pallidum TaxID=69527 RepID=A0A4P9TM47_9EURY|nr:sigma-70 region 4 domain-containing protein [Natrinema pallidum]QCW05282.1 DUF134 domain-containing protein [Natrinema pallidum]